MKEGKNKQQQPLTDRHHFHWTCVTFAYKSSITQPCHLPDFRNPSSASGEAETSEASEEDRTTSGKSEDPPGAWLGGSVEWDPCSEKEHSASRTGGDSLVEDGVETKELGPLWVSLSGLHCAGTPPSNSDLATEFTWHGETCWWKNSSSWHCAQQEHSATKNINRHRPEPWSNNHKEHTGLHPPFAIAPGPSLIFSWVQTSDHILLHIPEAVYSAF